eukprot:SAG25_NODE_437_length_8033_cov_16.194199_7_plen_151_part_00
MPRKPLELSDRDDPVSPTVPALQLELHHPAPPPQKCLFFVHDSQDAAAAWEHAKRRGARWLTAPGGWESTATARAQESRQLLPELLGRRRRCRLQVRGTYRGWRPPLRGNICLQPVQNCTPSWLARSSYVLVERASERAMRGSGWITPAP